MGKKQTQSNQKQEQVPLEDFQKIQGELEEIKGVSLNLDNQLKRAVADYQNLEKRVQEGRSEINSWAVNDLLGRIAGVIHYFDQAFKGVSEEEQKSSWFKGVQMATLQLKQVLKEQGLEEIEADPSAGSGQGVQFDPALHEAVHTKEGEDGKILEVVEKGYKLNDKILKPARVIVGKKLIKDE